MNLTCIDPTTDPLWQALAEQYDGDVFQAPGWLSVLRQTYDFDLRAYVLVDDAGVPRAGVPFCVIDDMMDRRIVSLPFSDFCDPFVSSLAEWRHLSDQLLAEQCRLSFRFLHNQVPLADDRFELANRARWHAVDLGRDEDALWEGLDGSARRAIRKAERSGVVVRIASTKDDLRAFFDLHMRLRKYKYQLLAQPYRFFENIWDQFIAKGQGALMLAIHRDEVLGGVMYLEWQNKLFYKFNASNQDAISVRPNDLVVWHGMRYGRAKGYRYLDFGLSDWDQEGLLRYKRKFATEEKVISFLRHTPPGAPTDKEKKLRALLPQLTDLFVNDSVPDAVTEKAGDILYRLFT